MASAATVDVAQELAECEAEMGEDPFFEPTSDRAAGEGDASVTAAGEGDAAVTRTALDEDMCDAEDDDDARAMWDACCMQ